MIFRGVFWFVLIDLGIVALLIFYPSIVLFLPDIVAG
jgi:TRAP-type mannitol/chloroaromatic compound transport system permease large subunit